MSNKEAKAPVPFSVMNGDPELFIVGEKKYYVKPMPVGEALKFVDDDIVLDKQIFNLALKDRRKKIDKYLSEYCTNEKGEPMSLQKITDDNWNIVDLKHFIWKLCDISG